MGNLTRALKENERLKNQNTGLLEALKRKNGQLEGYKAESAKALKQISDMVSAYIGAICLEREDREIKVLHTDIKRVLADFDVELELGDDSITFKLVEKSKGEI